MSEASKPPMSTITRLSKAVSHVSLEAGSMDSAHHSRSRRLTRSAAKAQGSAISAPYEQDKDTLARLLDQGADRASNKGTNLQDISNNLDMSFATVAPGLW